MKKHPYFCHDIDSRNDQKITKIRQKYGAKGYGIYFMLIEMLRSSGNYELDMNIKTLSYDIREDEEIIEDIIRNFGLFTLKKKSFHSEALKNRMENLDRMRDHFSKAGKKRWEGRDIEKSIYKEFQG